MRLLLVCRSLQERRGDPIGENVHSKVGPCSDYNQRVLLNSRRWDSSPNISRLPDDHRDTRAALSACRADYIFVIFRCRDRLGAKWRLIQGDA